MVRPTGSTMASALRAGWFDCSVTATRWTVSQNGLNVASMNARVLFGQFHQKLLTEAYGAPN